MALGLLSARYANPAAAAAGRRYSLADPTAVASIYCARRRPTNRGAALRSSRRATPVASAVQSRRSASVPARRPPRQPQLGATRDSHPRRSPLRCRRPAVAVPATSRRAVRSAFRSPFRLADPSDSHRPPSPYPLAVRCVA